MIWPIPTPINIAMLSRFTFGKKEKPILFPLNDHKREKKKR